MAGDHVQKIAKEDDFKAISAAKKAVIVDYWAAWCGPCQMMAPKFKELAAGNPQVGFASVDIDDDGLIEFVETREVESLPTFVLYVGGVEKERVIGANFDKLKLLVEKANSF